VPGADHGCVEAEGQQRGRRDFRWSREDDGIEFSRIVAFSDGVFAIAITLLVLNLQVPADLHGKSIGDALNDQSGNLLAYGLSFAVIGRLWLVHHRFFAEVTHFDGRLMALNLAYLGFVVLIPFTTDVLGNHGDTTGGVVLYAIDLSITNLIGAAMFLYAARAGVTNESFTRYVDSPLRLRNVASVFVFALSIPIALFSPTAAIACWFALFFVRNR
jgi:uncharacterized membrane protein